MLEVKSEGKFMVSQQICKLEPKRTGGEKSVEYIDFIPGRNLFL